MNPLARALLTTVLLGLVGASSLPAAPVIRIAVENNNAPLAFLDAQGRPAGFMVELVREMSRVSGIEMEVVPGFWRAHFAAFDAGKVHVLGNLADTPSNRADLNLSVGHARMHAVIYTPSGRPGLHTIADFVGKTIATVRGTAANAQALVNDGWGAKIITYPTWAEAFAATKNGTCHATLFSNQLYRVTIDERELNRNFVEDLVYAYHFGVRKDDLQTLAILNEALAQLMRNGEFDRLYAKWLGPIEPRQIRFADLKPYLLPIGLGLAAIVAFILWQRHLLRRLGEHASALRVSEQRWRFALDGSGAAVWDWDLPQGRVFYSAVLKRTLGYTDTELGDTPEETLRLLHPEDRPKVEAAFAAQRAPASAPFAIEQRMRCKNGSWKWILSRGTVVERTADGQPRRLIGTFSDLTLAKQAEEDRLVLGKLESTGILAGGIAHDFNNLLTTIVLNLDLALWPQTSREQAATYLEDIKKSIAAARHLTHQLITFARGGAPVRRPTALPELLRENTSLALNGAVHRLQFDFPEDLPWVEVDPGQIGQAVRNIVQNAREAMTEAGTVTLSARDVTLDAHVVRGLPAGRYVRLSISDTGPGIPPEIALRLFDPYFSTKQRGVQKGMGLGLTISMSIVTRHRGTITVDSTPGQGATFHLYLPALVAAGENAPVVEPRKPLPSIDLAEDRPGRVLLMDDDPGVRTALAANLRKLGYRVEATADGKAAIAAYRLSQAERDPFEVVLLDLTVRDAMGGLEALEGLRQIDPDVSTVLMSGYADNEVLRDHRRYGFKSSVTKPFTVEALRAAMKDARD